MGFTVIELFLLKNDQSSDLQSNGQQLGDGNMNQPGQNGGMPVGNIQDNGYQTDGGMDNVPMDDNQSEMQPDDEVIDVDDLTNAQEETEEKVDGVNTQLLRLLKVVSKYSDAIDRQNLPIAEALISSGKLDFKLKNKKGFNVLHQAALRGKPQ